MRRHLLAVLVVAADTALLVAGHHGDLPLWVAPVYALVAATVVVLRYRAPVAAFVAVLVLASLTGGSYLLLLWAAYQAGHSVVSRSGTAMVAGAGLGCFAVQLLARPVDPHALSNLVATYVVFVALPLLVGRYLAQHQRLVSALDRHNRQLRRERELLAERERLRERLLIARNMHDSLGHRLSLVSIQAAALEVSELPPRQRQAVRQLATAARGAMDELHELVGALRQQDETGGRSPGVAAISEVVEEFRAAGMPVTLLHRGEPQPLPMAVGQAAYRVVEEGLTNAAKHAPGQRVTVCAEWEPDALLLTVVNGLPDRPTAPCDAPAATGDAPAVRRGIGVGHGLTGLSERVRLAGGFLDRKPSDGEFHLVAMLPAVVEEAAADDLPAVGRIRTVVLGFATAALMFVVLPAGMLLGAG